MKEILDPDRSGLRVHIALYALKNYLLNETGVAGNEPTVLWYQKVLMRFGRRASTAGVRLQLDHLAAEGVFDKTLVFRRKQHGCCKAERTGVAHYHLNEAIYPALEKALACLLKKRSSINSATGSSRK